MTRKTFILMRHFLRLTVIDDAHLVPRFNGHLLEISSCQTKSASFKVELCECGTDLKSLKAIF